MFVLMNYGNQWRLHRRVFHQSFNADAVLQYRPVQLASARRLLFALLQHPHEIAEQVQLYVSTPSRWMHLAAI